MDSLELHWTMLPKGVTNFQILYPTGGMAHRVKTNLTARASPSMPHRLAKHQLRVVVGLRIHLIGTL
jgi:hypothetical protein